MYPKLTYILISISMALLASSCSSDTNEDLILSEGAEMTFSVSDFSRASVTTDIDRFAVYGDMKSPGDLSIPVALFNYSEVALRDGKWFYNDTKYWAPKREHSFVAVAPLSIQDPGNNPRYLNSHLYFEYTIPATEGNLANTGDVDDILVATHRRYYEPAAGSTTPESNINFKFDHILSLINIAPAFSDNLMGPTDYILFHKLEFEGVTTKAQFDIVPASRLSNSQTDDRVMEIESRETGNLSLSFSPAIKVENNARNVRLFADNDAIIMIPRDFAANSDSKIVISYTISGETSMRQVSIPLENVKWESGRSYLYNFTIERSGSKYENCEINDWNEIKGDEIIVD